MDIDPQSRPEPSRCILGGIHRVTWDIYFNYNCSSPAWWKIFQAGEISRCGGKTGPSVHFFPDVKKGLAIPPEVFCFED